MSKQVEPLDEQDEDIHAELLRLFRVYFQANQDWLNKETKRSAIHLRQVLSEIRMQCTARRELVRRWAVVKEAKLAERQQKRKAKHDT
jgi:outer membrane lipopolysaccharide assembly protein LptE/RlpB